MDLKIDGQGKCAESEHFPSSLLIIRQPWSLGGDKGPERWPHHRQILLTLLGRQTDYGLWLQRTQLSSLLPSNIL